ncbi:hypothetical protein EDD16DRAFT_910469 [Pisolithus croceorrhizus]|nr:hypothetical protein EDD16DRAFT_910469 [Pisolithus croceorrhizus]
MGRWRMILGEFLALGASGKNGQGVSSRSWPGVIRGRDGWYGSSCSCVLSNWKAGGTSSSEKEHTARGSPTQSGLLNGGFVGYESSNLDMTETLPHTPFHHTINSPLSCTLPNFLFLRRGC